MFMKSLIYKIASIIVILSTAALIGCSGKNADSLSGKPYDEERDPAVIIDGKSFSVKGDIDELLAVVPGSYEYSEALSCMTAGYDKTYDYGFIVIETVPSGEKDRISRISVTGEGAETPRGIKVGSTRSDIVNAYGENGFIENSNLVFSKKGDKNDISGTKIYFRLEDDIVTEFIVFDPGF